MKNLYKSVVALTLAALAMSAHALPNSTPQSHKTVQATPAAEAATKTVASASHENQTSVADQPSAAQHASTSTNAIANTSTVGLGAMSDPGAAIAFNEQPATDNTVSMGASLAFLGVVSVASAMPGKLHPSSFEHMSAGSPMTFAALLSKSMKGTQAEQEAEGRSGSLELLSA